MLSLFSGIGGLDLAAEWAGMHTVAFCERDKYCQKVLAKHWPGVPIFDDVTTLKGEQVGTVDVITGGYPCQPFSVAGKRRGEADERYLWPEFLRLVRELRPAWVVGENVAGHVTKGLDTVCNDLEGEGYAVQAFVFPASAVGANHQRERCFVVAHADHNGAQDCGQRGSVCYQHRNGQASQRERHKFKHGTDCNGEDVSDSAQLQRNGGESQSECTVSKFGNRHCTDGRHWLREPAIRRVVDGPITKLHEARLRAIGNAVVPQQAYPIFKAIADISMSDCARGMIDNEGAQ